MIGLDTNVLVRYLVADDPAQTRAVRDLVHGAADREEPLFVGSIVLCELVWVLESAYGHGREQVAQVLETLLLTEQLTFEDRASTWRAVSRIQAGSADFSDFLVGEVARAAGCDRTATLDGALEGEEGFELLAGG